MIVLGVLVSGSGTNLQAILDAIVARTLDARIAVVVSNVAGAAALDRARAAGVDTVVVDHGAFADRAAFDAAVVLALRERGVEAVVLAGFMRLVTTVLLDVAGRLLDKVAQRQALEYGVRVAGCTVHFVDTGTDTGPVIAQAAVPVHDDDDEATLGARILAREHDLLPRVLQWIAEGRVSIDPPSTPGGRARVRVRGHVQAL